MNLSSISIHSLSEALAWTIFHSIWQAVLIAGLLALASRIINKNNAQLRYTMASLSMLLIFVLAGFTFFLSLPKETLQLRLSLSSLDSNVIVDTTNSTYTWSYLKSLLPTHILFPILLRTWLIGTCLLSFRMVINYTRALRLKNHKAFPLSEKYMILANKVLTQFEIKKKILFRESASIDSPSLIGYFKPVILLPISLMSGIPDNQLEIIIAHELAHISRHDYLVQFIQGIIEILFFYHPMVWWLSSVVNTEREHICDDLAVKVCGESLTLIKALNNMESIRRKKPELVLNFSGKKANLLHRVRRILNPVTVKHPKLERGLMSVLFVFAVSVMILFSNLANSKNKVQLEPVNVKQLSFNALDNEEIQDSKIILPLKAEPIKLNQLDSLNKKKKEEIKITKIKLDLKNQPLYIIDGVELSKDKSVDDIDPNEIEAIDVLKDKSATEKYGNKAANGVILITTKSDNKSLQKPNKANDVVIIDSQSNDKITLKVSSKGDTNNPPLYIVDGVEYNGDKSMKDIDPNEIKSIDVLKDKLATEKYGVKAENGVILITTKSDNKSLQKPNKANDVVIIDYKSNDKTTVEVSSKGNTKNPPLYIVDGVEFNGDKSMKDIDPNDIETMNVLKGKSAIEKYGAKGKNGVIEITSKKNIDLKKKSKKRKSIKIKGKTKNPPLYIIDGVEYKGDKSMKDIDPNDIESMNVLKGKTGIDKYGKKAKNGVLEITTKGNKKAQSFNEYIKEQ
ncbi:M56 family metallopeptidase [Ancylomarina sp. 16SWW S1-10-2]|uniref:M56 family metallopeptidase n=1 Tax=Ancylomarina sp. 16SWW S1-10-2 TaxID=2499681 RepID=UPI0012ADAC61|nr:M56 family metallopeptidase [Ancylomarina sp. 16SWW S1-10-2]MRT92756.1 M56 family peptidase [Ancylomarina sp. 16SWW S1-10-2]